MIFIEHVWLTAYAIMLLSLLYIIPYWATVYMYSIVPLYVSDSAATTLWFTCYIHDSALKPSIMYID